MRFRHDLNRGTTGRIGSGLPKAATRPAWGGPVGTDFNVALKLEVAVESPCYEDLFSPWASKTNLKARYLEPGNLSQALLHFAARVGPSARESGDQSQTYAP